MGTAFKALDVPNLRRQALAKLRAGIVTGQIEAGRLYPISYFATQLGVSATPVREALLDLANEGLVEVVRNRGFRVVKLTEADLDEIFQLRLMLEVPALREICGKLSPEKLAEHRRDAEAIARCARKRDLEGFLESDRAFHLGLLARTNNRRLCSIVSRLRDLARLYGLPSLIGSDVFVQSADEHLELLDALESGHCSRVERLMTRHLEHTRDIWAGKASREKPREKNNDRHTK
ncbi:MAG: GntR family transcriptional regulator [Casimicrobiaceae bacterium]